jgi:hypothetical protein
VEGFIGMNFCPGPREALGRVIGNLGGFTSLKASFEDSKVTTENGTDTHPHLDHNTDDCLIYLPICPDQRAEEANLLPISVTLIR